MVWFRLTVGGTVVIAGFFTGGALAVRGGVKAARNSAIGCACLLAIIEGVGIGLNRVMAANNQPQNPPVRFFLLLLLCSSLCCLGWVGLGGGWVLRLVEYMLISSSLYSWHQTAPRLGHQRCPRKLEVLHDNINQNTLQESSRTPESY